MLARAPKPDPVLTVSDFETALTIPAKPAQIDTADLAWRNSISEREAAQARHREAVQQYECQKPGQPMTITRAMCDEIGAGLAALFEVEEAARRSREQARDDYERAVVDKLGPSLRAYLRAIQESVNELERLLQVGCLAHANSVAAGVKLPSNIAGLSPHLLKHLQFVRTVLSKAN